MKTIIKKILPDFVLKLLRRFKSYTIRKTRQIVERLGFNISRTSDYYSPLPIESKIKKYVYRWNKPSSMAGIAYDVENYKTLLKELLSKYWVEFNGEQARRIMERWVLLKNISSANKPATSTDILAKSEGTRSTTRLALIR